MLKDGDIFGDGVNIAARLETLAEPGGICVSRGVRDHVRKMGQYAFEDLGEQSVKNIAQPIRAFRVRSANGHAAMNRPNRRQAERRRARPNSMRDPAEFELAFWEAMKDSRDPAEFAAYLEQYPAGAFAALAKARRQALLRSSDTRPKPARRTPISLPSNLPFGTRSRIATTQPCTEAYLERYPEGAFAALAKVQLSDFDSSPASKKHLDDAPP